MELSQLRAFVAVSRARTIAAAAEYLHVTPSPLSRTIRELERQLGGELFDRNYHELLRTELGERSLPLAVEIVRQADELASIGSGSTPTFRYGGTPWTSKRLTQELTDLVASLTAYREFDSELSSVLLESMRHGDLDLALVHLPIEIPGISSIALAQYRYAVMTMNPDLFDQGRPLLLSDLSGMNLLSLPLMMQPAPMKTLLDSMTAAGVASIIEIDLRDVIGIQSRMTRTGEVMLGTSSGDLPTARLFDFESMHVFPIADGQITFEVGLAWRTRDAMHGETVKAVVEAMRPPDGLVPHLGDDPAAAYESGDCGGSGSHRKSGIRMPTGQDSSSGIEAHGCAASRNE